MEIFKSSRALAIFDRVLMYCFFFMTAHSFMNLMVYSPGLGMFDNFKWYWRINNISSLMLAYVFRKELWGLIKKEPFTAILMLYLVCTVFWSVDPILTLKRSYSLVANFSLSLYFVYRFTFRERFALIRNVLYLISILSFIVIVLFPFIGIVDYPEVYIGAWKGILPHKNDLGITMFFASLYVLLDEKAGGKSKIMPPIMLFLIGQLLFYSCALGALLSSLFVLLWMCIALSKKLQSPKKMYTSFCMVIFLVALICSFAVTRHEVQIGQTVNKLKSGYMNFESKNRGNLGFISQSGTAFREAMELVASVSGDMFYERSIANRKRSLGGNAAVDRGINISGRMDFWPLLIKAGLQKPIGGYGYYAFWSGKNPVQLRIIENFYWKQLSHAHNAFIQLFLDSGFIGLALFLMSFMVVLKNSIKSFITGKNQNAVYPLTILIAIMMTNLTECGVFWVNSIALPFYVVLTYGMVHNHEQQK